MKRSYLIPILLSAFLILSACNMPAASAPESSALSTAAAQTVQAVLSPAATKEASPIPGVAIDGTTAEPPTADCEDIAQYTVWTRDNVTFDVNEVNKRLAPGKVFTISWTLQNTGTCTWNSDYQMHFDSGAQLTTTQQFPLIPVGETVAPGDTVTVNIPMTAPDQDGEYLSDFSLQNDRGEAVIHFGVPTKVGSSLQPLASPGDLRYTYDCTTGTVNIALFWVDRAGVEDGYRIYRGETKLADLPAGSTTYSDIAPGAGEYSYTVAAFSEGGESRSRVQVDTQNCQ